MYQLEAVGLGDPMWLSVRPGARIAHSLGFSSSTATILVTGHAMSSRLQLYTNTFRFCCLCASFHNAFCWSHTFFGHVVFPPFLSCLLRLLSGRVHIKLHVVVSEEFLQLLHVKVAQVEEAVTGMVSMEPFLCAWLELPTVLQTTTTTIL